MKNDYERIIRNLFAEYKARLDLEDSEDEPDDCEISYLSGCCHSLYRLLEQLGFERS